MPVEAKKKPRLTYKEIMLIKGIAAGKTKQEAALAAYDARTPETASAIATETLKKPKVREALDAALLKHGIDIDTVIAPVGKALNAKVRLVTKMGNSVVTEIDDLEMQLKGHDRAVKLMGLHQQEGGNTINFFNIATEQKNKYGL